MCDNFNDWARESKLLPKSMALVGGLLCGIGWFLFVDGTAKGFQMEDDGDAGADGTTHKVVGYSWLPPFFATASFIMSVPMHFYLTMNFEFQFPRPLGFENDRSNCPLEIPRLNTIPWNRLNADETEYHGSHVALKTRCI